MFIKECSIQISKSKIIRSTDTVCQIVQNENESLWVRTDMGNLFRRLQLHSHSFVPSFWLIHYSTEYYQSCMWWPHPIGAWTNGLASAPSFLGTGSPIRGPTLAQLKWNVRPSLRTSNTIRGDHSDTTIVVYRHVKQSNK